MVGLNSAGLAVGTTNVKTRGSRVGVGYMGILHRMLACTTFDEAARVCETAPRAAAHTYWLCSPEHQADWETTATSCVRRDVAERPLFRSNHCLVGAHSALEAEGPSSSSRARLARLDQRLTEGRWGVAELQGLFADRSDGVDSICRYAEDGQGTATDSCVITLPARGELWACRGPADRGRWIRLDFRS